MNAFNQKVGCCFCAAALLVVGFVRAEGDRCGQRYFADKDGKGWIPVGLNICFSRDSAEGPVRVDDRQARCAEFEGWIRDFAAQGGNSSSRSRASARSIPKTGFPKGSTPHSSTVRSTRHMPRRCASSSRSLVVRFSTK